MKYRTCRTPRQLIQKLAEEAIFWSGMDRRGGPPGAIIERLPEREREMLRRLTAEDTQNVRLR